MTQTTITLLFLAFAIVMFILEKIPLGLTATIVAVGLNVTGVLGASDTFAGYVNSNVILCVGMFVVGQALFETGMANKIGGIVTKFAKSERILIIAIMVIVGVMSGFLSNTGTAAVLIPVVCGIADESGYSRGKLLMPLVFAAALGGNLSIIGAPGNLMGIEAMENLGMHTGFFEYLPVGGPMLLIGILYFAVIGYKFLPDTKGEGQADAQKDYSHVPQWKQITSLVVLIVVILAMIFEEQIGISLQVSACVGAVFLVLVGVIDEKAALTSIDLKVVLLFGGSLALAKALETTGAGTLIADTIVGALGEHPNPIILLLVHRRVPGPEPGGRPPEHDHRHRHLLLLRLCHSHRYARQHHGGGSRRLQVQRLRQVRPAPDSGILCDLHGPAAHPLSVLPLIAPFHLYRKTPLHNKEVIS